VDSDNDGGGDACAPDLEFRLCGAPFLPPLGINPNLELPSFPFPDPVQGPVVHPVIQLSTSLMEGDREQIQEAGATIQGALSRNLLLAAIPQNRLAEVEALPFVRSIFPLPAACRRDPPPVASGATRPCPSGVGQCPVVEVRFHDDIRSAVAEAVLNLPGVGILKRGVTVGGRRVNTWQVVVPPALVDTLAQAEPVLYVTFVKEPIEFNDGSREAIGADVAQIAPWCGGSGCRGSGIVVAEWDGGWAAGDPGTPIVFPGSTHGSLDGRITIRDREPVDTLIETPPAGCEDEIICPFLAGRCSYSWHGTHVAGTILADATVDAVHFGMAPQAELISYVWPTSTGELACEYTDASETFGARVANNSWGFGPDCDFMALYGGDSAAFDEQVRTVPDLAVTFAAGNTQRCRLSNLVCPVTCDLPAIYTAPTCTELPPDITPPPAIAEPPSAVTDRFFTLGRESGQTAKNTLVVGAINSGVPSFPASLGRMTTFSAWGPTQDGRLKPDLVTAGSEDDAQDPDPMITSTVCDPIGPAPCATVTDQYAALRGTSMANPALTGAAALVLEEQAITGLVDQDVPLDSDSLRALLIHTAIDLPVHFPLEGAFMALEPCAGVADGCWPVPVVEPVVQDGPDYVNGWGLLDLPAALAKVQVGNPQLILRPSGCPTSITFDQMPFNSPLALGGDPESVGLTGCSTDSIWDWVGYIEVAAGVTQLKVTIVWDDLPAVPPGLGSTEPLLIHDLDLVLTPGTGMGSDFTPTGPHHYSWFLDPACPYLQAVPVVTTTWSPDTYADHRNNVEQVVVPSPVAGQWRVVVQSIGLTEPQPFAMMISTD
jgi:hypothetical protein